MKPKFAFTTLLRLLILLIGFALSLGATASAGVVVLSNKSQREVQCIVSEEEGKPTEYSIPSGELIVIPARGEVALVCLSDATERHYRIQPNSAYYVKTGQEGPELEEIQISRSRDSNDRKDSEGNQTPGPTTAPEQESSWHVPLASIPVKLLVDQGEPRARGLWEERLRMRVEAASEILERHCGVRFEVVATETWDRDARISDLRESLADFEKKVNPAPARLAIGFCSQLRPTTGCTKLGGTRGPFHSHVLVQEWSARISERERLEVLVHELGHFLGAAHSSELDSVMRTRLGDGKSRSRKFRIGFDPLNTLAMCMVNEEVFAPNARSPEQRRAITKDRLGDIYREMDRLLPDDPVAGKYANMLSAPASAASPSRVRPTTLVESTRWVVAAIVRVAERNRELPDRSTANARGPYRAELDRLTEEYVRAAAAAATQLAPEHAAAAFLLGIGVAIDDSDLFRHNPLTRELCHSVESDVERAHRVSVIGSPTMRQRRDWAQHFVISAALTARYGPGFAETTGVLKEVIDMKGDSGFSFADLSADFAGIAFANQIRAQPDWLNRLPSSFSVMAFTPDPTELPEGLSEQQFSTGYGSTSDKRFLTMTAAIHDRIRALPAYQAGFESNSQRTPPN